MKRINFTLLACLFSSLVVAQKIIEFDFLKKTAPCIVINNIKRGDYYQIKIKDINQNLFKISLTSKDTVLSKPQQTPTFGSFDLDALSKVIAGIAPLSTEVVWQDFDDLLAVLKTREFFDTSVDTNNPGILARMDEEKRQLSTAKNAVEQIVAHIDDLKLEVYKLRLNSLKLSNPPGTFNFDEALKKLEKIRKDVSNLKADITTKKNAYEAFSTARKTDISRDAVLVANDKNIKESYEKFLSALSDVHTSISADKANELLSSIILIENNSAKDYTSLPMQFKGEQARIKISITPRDEKYNLQSYYSEIIFPENVKPYTVIGVSFYGSSLYDKAYSTIKSTINNTISYSFIAENANKAELGIAALLRYGKKWNDDNNFGGHFSIGTGLSIANKIKPRVLFGAGLSFGQKHMFAIDGGGIVGYVDRLSDAIDFSITYPEKPENITVSKLGLGAFISIGYVYQF